MTQTAATTKQYALIRCLGQRQSKQGPRCCDKLLAILDADEFKGSIEIVCPGCKTRTIYGSGGTGASFASVVLR